MSMTFQQLIKPKMLKDTDFSQIMCLYVVFILLIHFKMPTCWHFNIYEQDKFHAK